MLNHRVYCRVFIFLILLFKFQAYLNASEFACNCSNKDYCNFRENVKFILDNLYVYKSDYQSEIEKIKKVLPTACDDEAIMNVNNLIKTIHDQHLGFEKNDDSSCYYYSLPVSFRKILVNNHERIIIVNKDDLSTTDIHIGDEIVVYNSIQKNDLVNYDTFSLINLFLKEASKEQVPIHPVVLTIINSNKQQKEITIEWKKKVKSHCSSNLSNESNSKWINLSNKYQFTDNLNETPLPFSHKLIDYKGKKYGYIRIYSFSIEHNNEVNFYKTIAKTLLEMNDHTEGLIVDLRDNFGGSVAIASSLLQFFSPKDVTFPKLRTVMNSKTRILVQESLNQIWKNTTLSHWELTGGYSYPENIFIEAELNKMGQFYLKPVTILTNDLCYSACDLFVYSMSKNNGGSVFTENSSQTGGGNTEIVSLNLLQKTASTLFPFPINQNFKWNFTFSWREFIKDEMGSYTPISIIPSSSQVAENELLNVLTQKLNDLKNSRGNIILGEEKYNSDEKSWTIDYKAENVDMIKVFLGDQVYQFLLSNTSNVLNFKSNNNSSVVQIIGYKNNIQMFTIKRKLIMK